MTDPGQSAAASDATAQARDAAVAGVAAPGRAPSRWIPADLLRRSALTLSVFAALLIVGVLTQALWMPASAASWYESVAYGLPAFEAGRWWTPLTGTFLAAEPSHYVPITVLILGGLGWAERVLGARRAAVVFAGGQLFAIVATALLLLLLRPSGWEWAVDLAS